MSLEEPPERVVESYSWSAPLLTRNLGLPYLIDVIDVFGVVGIDCFCRADYVNFGRRFQKLTNSLHVCRVLSCNRAKGMHARLPKRKSCVHLRYR